MLLVPFFTAILIGLSSTEDINVKVHLSKYGYYNPFAFDGGHVLEEAIKDYQKFHGLKVTGQVNDETKTEMARPRCGQPDILPNHNPNAYYNLWRYTWGNTALTYRFLNTGDDLDPSVTKRAIAESFKRWSDVTPLTFTEVTDRQGNINIGWYSGSHGDNSPFPRGRGGILAHAFYPRDGRLHFDEDENWTLNCQGRGTDLMWVAIHEIGHALGLKHSNDRGAIMYPTYYRCVRNVQLGQDDKNGIRALYGSGGTGTGGGTCTDSNNRCEYWARRGECEKNPRWMKPNCKKSCKQC